MKLLFWFLIPTLLIAQGPIPVTVTKIDNINTSATVIDNRSVFSRANTVHTFCATGSGSWSATIQYSDAAVTGPWSNYSDNAATVTNASAGCFGGGYGYHAYIRFNIAGTVSISYTGQQTLYVPTNLGTGGGGGGGSVTSVNVTGISGFITSTGGPVTVSGSVSLALNTQATNVGFFGPSSGSPAAPTFRAMVPGDVPQLTGTQMPAFSGDAQSTAGTSVLTLTPLSSLATAWNSGTSYTSGMMVLSGGIDYVAIAPNTNQIPPNASFWASQANIGPGIVCGDASHIAAITTSATGRITSCNTVAIGGGTVTATQGNLTLNALILGNAGTDIKPLASLGTTTTLLHGNASGAPTFSAVSLSADVSGNLPTSNLNSGTSASSTTFWRGDGTWATPAGAGTVTNSSGNLVVNSIVIANGSSDIKTMAGPGTTVTVLHGNAGGAPTFSAVSLSADVTGNLPTSNLNGGTSASSATFWRGDGTWATPAGTGTVTATSGALTLSALMVGNSGTDSKVLASLGTTSTVLHGNAAGLPTFGSVNLTSDITGNLPVTNLNSGTSASSATYWRGDGTWATPAGAGTVTNPGGNLTNLAIVSGSGGATGVATPSYSPVLDSSGDVTLFGTAFIAAPGGIQSGSGSTPLVLVGTTGVASNPTNPQLAAYFDPTSNQLTVRNSSGTVVGSTLTAINLATGGLGGVTGNLPVTNLNGGTAATNTTFWRGDGVWGTPAGGGGSSAVFPYPVSLCVGNGASLGAFVAQGSATLNLSAANIATAPCLFGWTLSATPGGFAFDIPYFPGTTAMGIYYGYLLSGMTVGNSVSFDVSVGCFPLNGTWGAGGAGNVYTYGAVSTTASYTYTASGANSSNVIGFDSLLNVAIPAACSNAGLPLRIKMLQHGVTPTTGSFYIADIGAVITRTLP